MSPEPPKSFGRRWLFSVFLYIPSFSLPFTTFTLAAEEGIALCGRSRSNVPEAIAYGLLARALLRRDGAEAREAIEAASPTQPR